MLKTIVLKCLSYSLYFYLHNQINKKIKFFSYNVIQKEKTQNGPRELTFCYFSVFLSIEYYSISIQKMYPLEPCFLLSFLQVTLFTHFSNFSVYHLSRWITSTSSIFPLIYCWYQHDFQDNLYFIKSFWLWSLITMNLHICELYSMFIPVFYDPVMISF